MATAEATQNWGEGSVVLPMAPEIKPFGALAKALAEFQGEEGLTFSKTKTARVKSKRTGEEYTYKYADLADILPVVRPLLARHGLAWSSKPGVVSDEPVLFYRLVHESGEEDAGYMPLGVAKGCKPQELGSAITYARRYALTAQLNLATEEDDDGNTAQAAERQHAKPKAEAEPKPSERPANANQRGAINGRMGQAGLSANQQKAILNWIAGVAQLDRLPAAKASELLDALGDDGSGAAEILNEIVTEAEQGDERAKRIADRFFTTEE